MKQNRLHPSSPLSLSDQVQGSQQSIPLPEFVDKFSKLLLQRLADNAPMGITFASANLNGTYVNPAFLQMIGYKQTELAGFDWQRLTYHEDHAMNLDRVQLLLKSDRESIQFEKRYVHKKGHLIWCKLTISKVFDQNSQEYLIMAVIDEILDQKSNEKQLKYQSAMLKLGEKVSKTGTLIWNTQTNETEASLGIYDLYELDQSAITKENLFGHVMKLTHPDDVQMLKKDVETSAREKIKIITDYRIRFSDGRVKWVRSSPGDFLGENQMIRTIQDITVEKEHALKLESQAAMIRHGEIAGNLGVCIRNFETDDSSSSSNFYRLYGTDQSKMSAQDFFDLMLKTIHPDDYQSGIDFKKEISTNPSKRIVFDHRIVDDNKNVRWLRIISQPYLDQVSRISVIQDITESKQQAEDLAQSNHELEELLYTVSHDLRAPLRHISSYAQMVNKLVEPRLEVEEKKYLQNVIDASARLGVMIDELLHYFRSRNLELKKERIELNSLVKSIQDLFTHDTMMRDIKWEISELPVIFGDKLMIEKVFLNLLSNAVKFTAKKESALIRIEGAQKGKEVMIKVSDNGAGFKMKYKDKLFAVFQRLHKRRDFEGTGIGLANVQRIIQRHGGTIWAEGELEKGASFTFTIPLPN